jgi:uncharacterized protein YndB with AHSA1/START domain
MTAITSEAPTRAIVIEEVLPHSPEAIWTTLTRSDLIARWLMKNDFSPALGHRFTMQAQPMGDWDGTVRCEITAFDPPRLLTYTWVGGSSANPTHGSALDSTVTWTLTPVAGGTRLRMVHDGFRSPRNDLGYEAMSGGWTNIVQRIGAIAADLG